MNRKKIIGLRNIVTTKTDWYYLLFYDIDGSIKDHQWRTLDKVTSDYQIGHILYQTKHGYHFVGLTPIGITYMANAFLELKEAFGGYYSGQTIRLSLKEGEKQHLVSYSFGIDLNFTPFNIIPNLWNIYAKRFKLEPIEYTKKIYYLVLERYWTDKK